MMPIIAVNWLPLLLAFLIGIATAWWAWGWRAAPEWDDLAEDVDLAPATAPFHDADDPHRDVIEPIVPEPVDKQPVVAPPAFTPLTSGPAIAAAKGEPDNLMVLKGVGPKLNTLLLSLGITRFDQIAQWTKADIIEVDKHLGAFSGRIERDQWVEQARLLAAGNLEEFLLRFDRSETDSEPS